MNNKFYLGMAIKATIFAGAAIGASQTLPIFAEEIIEETTPVTNEVSSDSIESQIITTEESIKEEAVSTAAQAEPTEQQIQDTELVTQSHVANIGWMNPMEGDATTGTTGRSLPLEAIKVDIDSELEGSVQYKTYSAATGWSEETTDGQVSGTTGLARPIEAFQATLTDELAEYYSIYYRAHVANVGWMGWAYNGQTAGTVGYGNALEALEFKLIRNEKEKAPVQNQDATKENAIQVQAHVANIGWQGYAGEGDVSGTTGQSLSIEAVKIKLNTLGTVQYSTYVDGQGWQSTVKNNAISGTTGKALPVHAIKITLSGAAADKYDVCYKAHVSNIGWMNWVSNGEVAGKIGKGYNLEALQVELREKEIVIEKEPEIIEKVDPTPMVSKDPVVEEPVTVKDSETNPKTSENPVIQESDLEKTPPESEIKPEIVPNPTNPEKLPVTSTEEKEPEPVKEEDPLTKTIKEFLYKYDIQNALDVSKFNRSYADILGIVKQTTTHDETFNIFSVIVNDGRIQKDASTDIAKTVKLILPSKYKEQYDLLPAVNQKIDEILNSIHSEWSDFEKALYVYDWICLNSNYKESASNAHFLSGTLLSGEAVCQSFTYTFNTIMHRLGIATEKAYGPNHVISEVCLDGEWYMMDITHGNSFDLGGASHLYTFTSQSRMVKLTSIDLSRYTLSYSKDMTDDLATNTRYETYGKRIGLYQKNMWTQENGAFQYYNGYWYNGAQKYGKYDPRTGKYVISNEVWVYQYDKDTKEFKSVDVGLPGVTWKDTYRGLYIVGDTALTRTDNTFVKIDLKTGKATTLLKVTGTIKDYSTDYTGIIKYRLTGSDAVCTCKL